MAKHELDKVQSYVDAILAQMEANPGGFAYFMRTYLSCIRVLRAVKDEKAAVILEETGRITKIDTGERRFFHDSATLYQTLLLMLPDAQEEDDCSGG